MTVNRFDITLNGVQYRLARAVEGTRPYRKGFSRQLVAQQSMEVDGLQSRQDQAGFYQSSWSKGARWEIPLLRRPLTSVYETSSGMNPFSKPGRVLPSNAPDATNHTAAFLQDSPWVMFDDTIYSIGETGANGDWFKYTGTAFSASGLGNSGYTGSDVWAMTSDPENGLVWFLTGASTLVVRKWTPGAGNASSVVSTGLTSRPGSNLFVHNDRLFVYDGDKVYEIEDRVGTPVLGSAISNDGKGPDILVKMVDNATDPVLGVHAVRTSVATSDGVFYVKNVQDEGMPTAWIYRIDRDSGGSDIVTPVATLPPGNLAVSIMWHLGSLIVATVPDFSRFLKNDVSAAGHCRVEMYHLTQGQTGALGVMLGESLDETPCALLGAEGSLLFIGGQKRIWVWDAKVAAIHPWIEDPTAQNDGPYRLMARNVDSSSNDQLLFLGDQRYLEVKDREVADPDTVTNFGDDLTHYVLDSAYFDFGTPHEDKTLARLGIETDSLTASQQWSVYISVDDGAFTLLKDHSNAKFSETDLTGSAHTGKRFRYRLIYQTKNATNAAFRSIKFEAVVGKMVPTWFLVVDGSELRNLENKRVHPEDVFDSLETVAQLETPVTLIDNFRSERAPDTSTHTVKIMSAEMFKQSASEATIHLRLVEA